MPQIFMPALATLFMAATLWLVTSTICLVLDRWRDRRKWWDER